MNLPRPWAILAASLVADLVLFGMPADYPPPLHDGLVALLLLASTASAGFAARRALAGEGGGDAPRLRAVAAVLLVAPFVLFSLLLGIGPPRVQPETDNELRFLVLAVSAMAVGGGLMLLREALAAAGERAWAAAGMAAIVLASPLYVVFCLIQRIDHVGIELGWSWAAEVADGRGELSPLDALSLAVLFFGGALTYLSTIAFARSLARVGWFGNGVARGVQGVGVLGLAFLVARGFAYPSPRVAFMHWYTVPGFVAGIPAVPWIPLGLVGVLLLRRGDRERGAVVALNAPARRAAPATPT